MLLQNLHGFGGGAVLFRSVLPKAPLELLIESPTTEALGIGPDRISWTCLPANPVISTSTEARRGVSMDVSCDDLC